jgi:hypothetical protein
VNIVPTFVRWCDDWAATTGNTAATQRHPGTLQYYDHELRNSCFLSFKSPFGTRQGWCWYCHDQVVGQEETRWRTGKTILYDDFSENPENCSYVIASSWRGNGNRLLYRQFHYLCQQSPLLKYFSVFSKVTRTISAHEQHPVGPWLKTFPSKIIDRAPTYMLTLGGALGLTYGSIAIAESLTAAEDYKHRP